MKIFGSGTANIVSVSYCGQHGLQRANTVALAVDRNAQTAEMQKQQMEMDAM